MEVLEPLTERQAECLAYLYTYFVDHRYFPTQGDNKAYGVKDIDCCYVYGSASEERVHRDPAWQDKELSSDGLCNRGAAAKGSDKGR